MHGLLLEYALGVGLIFSSVQQEITIPYPRPAYLPPSATYKVNAGGTALEVADFHDYHFARFASASAVEVSIEVAGTASLEGASVSPKSFGILPAVTGRTVDFTVLPPGIRSQPNYLVIQIPGQENLVLLIDQPEAIPQTPADVLALDVSAAPYFADGTGEKLATEAIQRAIDDASAAGGGLVVVPKGHFRVTQLVLRGKNIRLHLDHEAVISGSTNPDDYPERTDGKRPRWIGALVRIESAENCAITGRGVLSARGTEVGRQEIHGKERDYHRQIIMGAGPDGASKGLRIEGVLCLDATEWSIKSHGIDELHCREVKVLNNREIHWNDGIDIVNTRRALVERCFVYTGDDAFCVKTWRVAGLPVSDVVYRDSIVHTSAAAAKVGPETLSDISRVRFENIDVIRCKQPIVVDLGKSPNSIRDIMFRSIRVEFIGNFPPSYQGLHYLAARPVLIKTEGSGWIFNVGIERVAFPNRTEERSALVGGIQGGGIQGVLFDHLTLGDVLAANPESGHIWIQGNVKDIEFKP
jgi:hypothetical protein